MEEMEVNTGTGNESQTAEQTEQEVVNPAQENNTENSTNPAENTEKPKQSAEDNRKFADIRRKAEAEAKAKMQKELDGFFANRYAGKTHNGKAITSRADAEAYEAAQDAQRTADARKKQLIEAGVPEELASALSEDAAQLESLKAQQQRQSAERQQNEAMAAMENAVAELAKAFPDSGIKTLADLENHPEVIQQAMRLADGNLVDAYYLAHRAEIEEKRNAAARQSAINSARGAEHMTATPAGKTTETDVVLSADELATWHGFGFTTEQAIEQVKKYKKGK